MKHETQTKPREYQDDISSQAAAIMQQHGCVYLAMQVRTGKTITALMAAEKYGAKTVLFISKKKALESISMDFKAVTDGGVISRYQLIMINYESLHKLDESDIYNVIICDEAHGLGQYPKPSQRAENVRAIVQHIQKKGRKVAMIYLSGTPTPESYAQMFHQFWAGCVGPWGDFKNFYDWFKQYGTPAERWLGQRKVAVYDNVAAAPVMADIKPYLITWTQQEADFNCPVIEQVEVIPMPAIIRRGIDMIKKDGLIIMKNGDTIEGSEGHIRTVALALLLERYLFPVLVPHLAVHCR